MRGRGLVRFLIIVFGSRECDAAYINPLTRSISCIRSEMTLYLKGYKLDNEKIRSVFPRQPRHSDDDYVWGYYEPIIDSIPRDAYNTLLSGRDSDGKPVLVFVLALGYDREELEDITVTPDGFPKGSLEVLTLGIWEY